MPIMVALKVRQYYPKQVAVVPIEDDDTNLFGCALYKLGNHQQYAEVLYELGHYNHREEIAAVEEMVEVVANAMKVIRTMSN